MTTTEVLNILDNSFSYVDFMNTSNEMIFNGVFKKFNEKLPDGTWKLHIPLAEWTDFLKRKNEIKQRLWDEWDEHEIIKKLICLQDVYGMKKNMWKSLCNLVVLILHRISKKQPYEYLFDKFKNYKHF